MLACLLGGGIAELAGFLKPGKLRKKIVLREKVVLMAKKILKNIYFVLDRIRTVVIISCVAFMVGLCTIQVILRYFA